MKIKKLGALLVSAALCAGMAAPAFAFEGEAAPVEQPVLHPVAINISSCWICRILCSCRVKQHSCIENVVYL